MDTSRGVPWTRWFTGGQFNYVATALDKHAERTSATSAALIWEGEDGEVAPLTYAELLALTQPGGQRARARWASARAIASASSCR